MSEYFEFATGMEVLCPSRYGNEIMIVNSVRGIVDRQAQKLSLHNQIVTIRHQDGRVDPVTLSGYHLRPIREISEIGSKSTLCISIGDDGIVLIFKNQKEKEVLVVCRSYPAEIVAAFETLESGKVGGKPEFVYLQSGHADGPDYHMAGHLEAGVGEGLLTLGCIIFVDVQLYRYEALVKIEDLKDTVSLLKKYFQK